MSWFDKPFISGTPKASNENTSTESKPLKRSTALLLMIPGLILFVVMIIYALNEGDNKALLGIGVYIILANILSSGKRTYDIWTIRYWSNDIFFKILFFPGRIVGASFISLYLLLMYNL